MTGAGVTHADHTDTIRTRTADHYLDVLKRYVTETTYATKINAKEDLTRTAVVKT
jgi:hypothetical protein